MYQTQEKKAYEDLFRYIRSVIIRNKKIVLVTSLTAKLELFMQSGGVDHLRDSTRKHIRRKLESELGESIDIFSDENGKLLLVPDSVTFREVVLENQRLHRDLRVWNAKSTNINKVIDQTSSHIRSVIRQDMTSTTWHIHPSDVNNNAYIIMPKQLERLLLGLLTGDPETDTQSHRIRTLVQSFSQDIIYAVICGQHKPPKHLLLPNAVKTLTGNVELIQTLNKL